MKTLFIGNSYTYCNNLPAMLRDLSKTAGKTVDVAAVTSGGKTLTWHWYNPASLDTIAEAGWDFVVLQDQSLRSIEEPEKLRSDAIRLSGRIREVNATPVLYVTWARQHIPEIQDVITETYMRVAREIDAKIAPVGPAWRKALAATPGLSLHMEDRSHPSILGTYLAACVFYATLFDETPVGLANEFALSESVMGVIDKDVAITLQKTAWASIQEFTREST